MTLAIVRHDSVLASVKSLNDPKVIDVFQQFGESPPSEVPFFGAQLRLIPLSERPCTETRYHTQGDGYETHVTYNQVSRIRTQSLKSLADVVKAKLEDVAHYRWLKETGGIEFGGVKIKTDEQSQAKVQGALTDLTRNPSETIRWKGEGGWIDLDKPAIEQIADKVAAHVRTCFKTESALSELIQSLNSAQAVYDLDLPKQWAATYK